jgi:hypothetical protein
MYKKRPKSADELFVRAVLQRGANPLMRKSGFKRPGGGWTFYRERPWTELSPLLDSVGVEASYPRRRPSEGTLRLQLTMSARSYVTLQQHVGVFPLDVLGDAQDLAVWVNHWLRTEGLPWFERPIDLEAIAREAEATDLRGGLTDWAVHRVASLWRLAGRADEALRLEAAQQEAARLEAARREALRGPDDDAPF